MAAAKFSLALFAIAVAVAVLAANHSAVSAAHDAPAPAADCSSLILQMADCLSFVSNGSTLAKPDGSCCSGIKTVLKTNADCLCQAFDNSAQFGIVLDVPKAITLPAVCKVDASAAKCKFLNSPSGSPAGSPASSPKSPAAAESGKSDAAPAPGKSAAAAAGGFVSIGSVIGAIAVAVFCNF